MTDTLRTVDLPDRLMRVQENSFFLSSVGEDFTGTFNPRPRSGGSRYRRWVCSLSLNALPNDPDGRDLRFEFEAFIHSLDGTATGLRIYDALRTLPKGVAAGFYRDQASRTEYFRTSGGSSWSISTGSRRVAGSGYCTVYADAARAADTVVLAGLTASATVFRAGDLIEVGGNLHEIAIDAVSDVNGRSAVRLNNRLWKPALADDIVTLSKPRGRFVLIDRDQGRSLRDMVTSSVSIDAIEVPYVE